MQMADKIRALLKLDHWNQEKLASAFKVSQSTVHRWLNGSDPRGSYRDAINALYEAELKVQDKDQAQVQLQGYVGAGQAIFQFDEFGGGFVDAPPVSSPGTVAVEVRGESMLPLYEDGTLLYYSKVLPPEQMIGRRCITKLADERVLVKTLRRGSERGLWTLVSLNAPDIEDVALEWAAPIDWIKPRS